MQWLFSIVRNRRLDRLAAFQALEQVDSMNGVEFEYFVADLLRKNWFHDVYVTKSSGDYGVDIFARKLGVSYSIQCKRYQGAVGVPSVQQVFSGAKKYGSKKAVVVTNSHFSKNAKIMAADLGVQLWDRGVLLEMMTVGYKEKRLSLEERRQQRDLRRRRQKQNNAPPQWR